MLRQRYSSREIFLRNYLKTARKRLGFTQSQLAKMCGLPQSFISKYELGERYLTYTEVLDLCKILKIDPQELRLALDACEQG